MRELYNFLSPLTAAVEDRKPWDMPSKPVEPRSIDRTGKEAEPCPESRIGDPGRSYSVSDIRTEYPKAYMPWTDDEDARLLARYQGGATVKVLSAEFARKPGAITSRLRRLEENGPIERIEGIGGYCLLYPWGYAMYDDQDHEIVKVEGRMKGDGLAALREDLKVYPILSKN